MKEKKKERQTEKESTYDDTRTQNKNNIYNDIQQQTLEGIPNKEGRVAMIWGKKKRWGRTDLFSTLIILY